MRAAVGSPEIVFSQDPPQHPIQLATDLYHRGDISSAMALIEELVSHYPASVPILTLQGACHASLSEFDLAINSFQRVLAIDPSDPNAQYNLATVYRNRGDLNLALEGYERTLQFDQNHVDALNDMGVVLNDCGRPESAATYLREALSLDPDFFPAYNNLALSQTAMGNTAEARDSWARALAINPDFVDALNNLGESFFQSAKPRALSIAFANSGRQSG